MMEEVEEGKEGSRGVEEGGRDRWKVLAWVELR